METEDQDETDEFREFGSMNLNGYKYVFDLENQTREHKDRCQYVIEDRRIFDSILIAANPDCIKFIGNDGDSYMTIDGVSYIVTKKLSDKDSFLFDVVCDIENVGEFRVSFLATKS